MGRLEIRADLSRPGLLETSVSSPMETSTEDTLLGDEFNFDDDMFSTSTKTKERKTRSARRECRKNGTQETFTREHLITEQKTDDELQRWKVSEKPAYVTHRDGVLCRRWIPTRDTPINTQVVLPRSYWQRVLRMAHDLPMAGHMGVERTLHRIRRHFWWPTVVKDTQEYCKSCDACQRTGKRNPRAPLVSMPIIGEPFRRIAMDFIGPLPRTSSGNQYVLVVVDYATRYPEAYPLRSCETLKN